MMRTLYRILSGGARKIRTQGFARSLDLLDKALNDSLEAQIPLSAVDRELLFGSEKLLVRQKEKKKARAAAVLSSVGSLESLYPHVHERDGRFLRYAHLGASGVSRGLVVSFHGHDVHQLLGLQPLEDFDLLAPWDSFGWRRQGSWFWGERGEGFVEVMVREVIAKCRGEDPSKPWFCSGVSMGGFAALYHGIKYDCDGIYAVAPQVDLRAKIADYGAEDRDNPYGYLRGETMDTVPDVLDEASRKTSLPPLYLIQNQYDSVNLFAGHAFRLLVRYNEVRSWYGLRIFPAIGHLARGCVGSNAEAALFFSLIAEKRPGRTVELNEGLRGAAGGAAEEMRP